MRWTGGGARPAAGTHKGQAEGHRWKEGLFGKRKAVRREKGLGTLQGDPTAESHYETGPLLKQSEEEGVGAGAPTTKWDPSGRRPTLGAHLP